MMKIPILSLGSGVTVASMYSDGPTGSVLVSLSDGRILRIDEITMLAWLTGDRLLSAQVVDGFGSMSPVGNMPILYALHNRIIEINKAKEQIVWKEVAAPFSATSEDEVVGSFTSPVMWGGLDFGFWDSLQWEQDAPEGTSISVQARVAPDPASILSGAWYNMTDEPAGDDVMPNSSSSSSDSPVNQGFTRSMNRFNGSGGYLQLRVVLATSVAGTSPSMVRLTASYATKFAVYFFTQKFIMKTGSDANSMFLTGTYSMPQNTEIRFGVAPGNATAWTDYTVVEPDNLATMPPGAGDRFKFGVKMSSWDDSPGAYPTLDEFAVMVGAAKDNLMNGGA